MEDNRRFRNHISVIIEQIGGGILALAVLAVSILLQSAEELVEAMNWKETTVRPQAIQRQLFPELSEEEEKIIECLKMYPDGMQINTLVVQCNIPVNRMASLLFDMEMKGMVRTLAGGMYRLLQ